MRGKHIAKSETCLKFVRWLKSIGRFTRTVAGIFLLICALRNNVCLRVKFHRKCFWEQIWKRWYKPYTNIKSCYESQLHIKVWCIYSNILTKLLVASNRRIQDVGTVSRSRINSPLIGDQIFGIKYIIKNGSLFILQKGNSWQRVHGLLI